MSALIPRASEFIQSGIEYHLHLGAQIFVSQHGETLVDTAIGQARPNVPMSRDTILFWLSAGKPVTAIAIAQLVEKEKLDLDARIVDFIPEFAEYGKDKITVRHILDHTCGFRTGDLVPENLPWGDSVLRVCESRMEPRWEVGEKAAYHSLGSWLILGEIIRLVDGRMPSEYLREEIFIPTGMIDSWVGMTPEAYEAFQPRLGCFYNTTDEDAEPKITWDKPEAFLRCQPASTACGPARDLARFYRMLLNGGEISGNRILSSEYVKQWTSRRRVGMFDHTFKQNIDWGYGFCINSQHLNEVPVTYGYGSYASRETFGHSGSQCSTAFADPERELIVIVIFNGRPGESKHQPRMRRTLDLIYEDLKLK